jgi:hypothetical protein|tara:strand:+ start:8256 stop:8672 length:417 start_codon:yes stop_codon:yes gene_type:complete
MARKKKVFNYQFIDCEKSFSSSIEVICTQTKEKVRMYHKQLARLIENKYRNNYSVFKATYIKKGNKPEESNRDENGEYNTAPEGYRQYLVTSYMFTKNDNLMEDSERSGKLNFLSECYLKRYKNSLDEVVKLAEQSYN